MRDRRGVLEWTFEALGWTYSIVFLFLSFTLVALIVMNVLMARRDNLCPLPLVEADGPHLKINPLTHWSREDVAAYRRRHDLPEHPLTAYGYRSIGCVPCTDRVETGEAERAGRWRGMAKTECGIHLALVSQSVEGQSL